MRIKFFILALLVTLVLSANSPAANGRVRVTMVRDEADAVLAILAKRRERKPIEEADWQRLFDAEGYMRLKKREASLNRAFTDDEFREFVLSDELLGRYESLAATLAKWTAIDPATPAARALLYLPADARITAKIYPVIKPRENSFVFELKEDPAIFLYLDPVVTAEQFDNTLAHELHHVGFGTACPSPRVEKRARSLSAGRQKVVRWSGAFGEGIAMLAAAGGPDRHPHEFSPAADRERWDRDVANFNSDLGAVEAFFRELLSGSLNDEQEVERARSFYGVQGPWYTVGWKMAATIESAFGRERLVAAACEPDRFLKTYNDAARKRNRKSREKLRLWAADVAGK